MTRGGTEPQLRLLLSCLLRAMRETREEFRRALTTEADVVVMRLVLMALVAMAMGMAALAGWIVLGRIGAVLAAAAGLVPALRVYAKTSAAYLDERRRRLVEFKRRVGATELRGTLDKVR